MSKCKDCGGSGRVYRPHNCADGTVAYSMHLCHCYDPLKHGALPKPKPKPKEEIKCDGKDGCGKWVHEGEWIETEVYCELCGDHSADKCPHCGEVYDNAWDMRDRRNV